MHLASAKHARKVEADAHLSRQRKMPEKEESESAATDHIVAMVGGNKQYYCNLCRVPLSGEPGRQLHLSGSEHRRKLAEKEEEEKVRFC